VSPFNNNNNNQCNLVKGGIVFLVCNQQVAAWTDGLIMSHRIDDLAAIFNIACMFFGKFDP